MKLLLVQIVLFLAIIALVQCQMRRITVEDYTGNVQVEETGKKAKQQENAALSKSTSDSPPKSKGEKAVKANKGKAGKEKADKDKTEKAKSDKDKADKGQGNKADKTGKATKAGKAAKTDKAAAAPTAGTKASNPPAPPVVPKIIQFTNNYDEVLSLYWLNTETDTGDLKLTDIAPRTSVNTTSFADHIFYAMLSEDDEDDARRATPMMITIVDKVDSYAFGPIFRPRASLHPAVKEINQVITNVRVKIKSLVRQGISVWVDYNDSKALIYEKLGYLEEEYFNTRENVTFYFTQHMKVDNILWTTIISKNHSYIVVEDKSAPPPREILRLTAKQLRYHSDYLEKTGFPWNAYYDVEKSKPRPPVHLFMWPAQRVGEVHQITSKHSYWNCEGKARFCQSLAPLQLELEVVSITPKVFIINNLLNNFEAETIKKLAKPHLAESYIGSGKNEQRRVGDTRTSSNAWLHRVGNPIMETLFLRAADVLQVPEHVLHRHVFAEDLQVVHYDAGEKYDAHYDWSNNGYPETRFITLLIYLSDMEDAEAGGETAFPKAPLNHTDDPSEVKGTGFKVQAGKCNAILFYNMLPDGNGDDLAYHAALPVIKGEKWVANFWVWDPKFH